MFDGDRLVDGPVTIVMDADLIEAVHVGSAELADDLEVVAFPDGTCLPGLIDSHVHLVGDSGPGALDRVPGYSDAEIDTVMTEALRRQLANGVTTIRDLGDRRWCAVDRRDRQRPGTDAIEPAILTAGPPLTSPRGHCWYLGGEIGSRDEIEGAIAGRVQRRVDIVKVMGSGGLTTPGTDVLRTQFSDEDLELMVDQAHSAGLPVTVHAHGLPSVEQAIATGADQIEHCSCLTENGFELSDRLLADLAEREIIIGGALMIPKADVTHAPPSLRAMADSFGGMERFIALRLEAIGRMVRAGVLISAGRDSGIGPALQHGDLATSIDVLVTAGADPEAALRAATSLAARACGIDDSKGRLRAGYRADLVVAAGDLRTSRDGLRPPSLVVLGGRRMTAGS
jgi:imidazolonepropionase-like amidohydrolase